MKKVNLPKKSIAALTSLMIFFNTGLSFADIKKDETVYVILNEDGSVNKTIVSEWINSDEKLGDFKDVSNLKNIKNVKGEEKPTITGENLSWNVDKEDLYYQGESSEESPIGVKISYELDGKRVSYNDIKGKSGNFKIKVKLTNREMRTVKVKGESRVMYVPFLAATEVLLDRENFKNIKVNSGEVIDDGKNCSVTFAAFPGLKESLDLDDKIEKYINIEDELIIEGNTTKFDLPTMMIVATPGDVDLKNIDESSTLNELSDALADLQKGSSDLLDGSKKLLDGNNELNSNFAKFDQGVKTLDKGSNELNSGINKLASSVPTLNEGTKTLNSGLNQLNDAQGKFSGGVESYVSNTSKLYDAYSSINNGIGSCYEGSKSLLAGINQGSNGIDSLISSTNNIDNIAANLNNIAASIAETNPEAAGQIKQMAGGLSQVSQGQRGGLSELKSGIGSLASGANSLNQGLANLNSGSATFSSNLKALVDAGQTLTSSSKQLTQATNSLKDGGSKLVSGTEALSKGASDLSKGSQSLVSGTKTLSDNSTKLLSGTNALAKGSSDLYKGVNKLKTEGLDKLYNEGNTKISDVKGLVEAKDQLEKLAKEYNSFAGISEGMDGKVKFIMNVNTKKSN